MLYVMFVISYVSYCCMYGIIVFCNLFCVLFASMECGALYCFHQRGTVCFVLSPRAWNCNVIRKRRIMCLCSVLSPPAWNCVLCIVSTSVEL